ncbi:stage II sporulation protein E [Sediminihabitans luteus]|uniref:Stage II sporulation protein E n=1 Tax=Sediminihabitans luteus TaxID=1138585 RepID=A0A2M9D0Z9_9CELL|nr:PP2C family protein-serine/threonine phosphatase [Sediminihabitans luteus]PJJ77862.1 stage II sporulation protein E [Sediminihabitans luteus]GII99780.1 hypothetical protein Slu03_21580 [Sediminihabitans luteus]
MTSDWFAAATGRSETGALARAFAWETTPLGDPSTWDGGLRSAVRLCFGTRFPIMLTWGPEHTMLYNDGYRDMLGDKHPAAFAAPADETWAEIWPDLEPWFDQVLGEGEPVWEVDAPLMMQRSGFLEETSFTFSYSPLRDSAGEIRGLMDIATETTHQVVDRRRLITLGELSTTLQELQGDVGDLARATIQVLDRSPDVRYANLYLRGTAGPVLIASTSEGRTRRIVPRHVLDEVLETRTAVAVASAVAAPLAAPGDAVAQGVLVMEANPHRPFDAANRSFLALLASAVGTAMSGTLSVLREIGELRSVSEALQAAMLPDDELGQGWHARYRPADGSLAVGGDWYDVIDLGDGRTGVVLGDCVGHGLSAAARMGQLRSASRALMLDNVGPAATIDGLDRFARTLPGAEFTSVFCGVLDTATHELTYATAGHPPPVLVRADGAVEWLDRAHGPSLTIARDERGEATTPLATGDTVLIYTDGLVERRGESLRVGLDRLGSVASTLLRKIAAEDLPDALIATLLPDGGTDDVALATYQHDESRPHAAASVPLGTITAPGPVTRADAPSSHTTAQTQPV